MPCYKNKRLLATGTPPEPACEEGRKRSRGTCQTTTHMCPFCNCNRRLSYSVALAVPPILWIGNKQRWTAYRTHLTRHMGHTAHTHGTHSTQGRTTLEHGAHTAQTAQTAHTARTVPTAHVAHAAHTASTSQPQTAHPVDSPSGTRASLPERWPQMDNPNL